MKTDFGGDPKPIRPDFHRSNEPRAKSQASIEEQLQCQLARVHQCSLYWIGSRTRISMSLQMGATRHNRGVNRDAAKKLNYKNWLIPWLRVQRVAISPCTNPERGCIRRRRLVSRPDICEPARLSSPVQFGRQHLVANSQIL